MYQHCTWVRVLGGWKHWEMATFELVQGVSSAREPLWVDLYFGDFPWMEGHYWSYHLLKQGRRWWKHKKSTGSRKKSLLSLVTYVPSGLLGFASTALTKLVVTWRREIQTCRNYFAPPCTPVEVCLPCQLRLQSEHAERWIALREADNRRRESGQIQKALLTAGRERAWDNES